MAKAQLTERQQEIVDLLEKGKTPTEIGTKLKISTNGVYQQMRRIRKIPGFKSIGNTSGTGGSGSTRKASTRKAGSTGRQSARTPQRAARPAPAAKPVTARDVLTAEVDAVKAQIAEEQEIVTQAEANIVAAKANIETLTAELSAREDTLAVLTGEKVAHARPAAKPTAAKANGTGKGGKGGARPAEAAPAATPEPSAEAQEADAAQAAAEAPQAAETGTADPFEGDAPEATPAAA